jgi:hypothetical protein
MYLDELSNEAKQIVAGRQALLEDFSELLVRVKTWLRSVFERRSYPPA